MTWMNDDLGHHDEWTSSFKTSHGRDTTYFRRQIIGDMGVSENSVPHCTQWFCWSLSLWKMAISLGRLTQHFQTNPYGWKMLKGWIPAISSWVNSNEAILASTEHHPGWAPAGPRASSPLDLPQWTISHDGSEYGAAIYGVPWIPSIYPLYVSIYIYTSTMDPSWVKDHWELLVPDGSEKSLQMVVSLGCASKWLFLLETPWFQEWFMVFPLGMRMG